MPVVERQGDLFEAPEFALAHGCNCAGVMGKGIAIEFRRRWPDMFARYRDLCLSGEFLPGDIFVWPAEDRMIFNLATQRTWRSKATAAAIREALRKTVSYAEAHNVPTLAMPRIGAGLGGVDWADTRTTLDEVVPENLRVTVYSPTH